MLGAIAEQGLRTVRCARRGVLLATIVALPAFAGTASAATVSRSGSTITYQANAGETNNTALTRPASSTYVFTETPGPLTAGTNCTQTGANVVTCVQSSPTVVANLLDQNDTFSASTVSTGLSVLTLNGGDGNDTLTAPNAGGSINSTLNGDNGNDTLTGGDGNDTLNGGTDAGMDRMTGNDGNDVLDGGPGIDRALYTTSTGSTTIDMDNNADDTDGLGNSSENVRDTVESITGSNQADTLTGACTVPNTLAGQGGNDSLRGDPTTCGSGFSGDFMGGGTGNDSMVGSVTPTATDGVDRVTYTANTSGQAVTVSLDGVANDVDGVGGTTDNVGRDIEYLYGGPEVDTFTACGGDASPCSGGNEALQGVSFWTGANNDTLVGSDFNDYFDGQAGADSQNCGGGANDMYKVDGADPTPNANCETAVP